MKINLQFILSAIFVGALGLSSCSPDYDTNFTEKELEVPHSSQRMISFKKEGGEQQIVVNTNIPTADWTAVTNAEWLTVEKNADGKGVTVKAPAYEGFKVREAKVNIAYGDRSSYEIKVSQMGLESILRIPLQDPFLNIDGTFYSLHEFNQKSIDVPIETNLTLDNIIIPDTVSFVHFDKSKMVTENGIVKLHFDLDPNTTNDTRYCTVRLKSSDNWDATIEYVIEQSNKGYKVRPVYPTNNKDVNMEMMDLARTYRVPFQRSAIDGTYNIDIPESAKSWLSTPKGKVSGSELRLVAALNDTDNPRSCDVVCTPTNSTIQPFTIHVTQKAFQNIVPSGVTNLNVTPGKGEFKVTWAAPDEVDYNKVVITAKSNVAGVPESVKEVDASELSCTLGDVFSFAGDYTITVSTKGLRGKMTDAPVTATAQSGVWTESVEIPLTADMVSASSHTGGHEISAAVDKDKATYFQTSSNGLSSQPKPYIDITLEQGIKGTFFINFDEHKVSSNDRNPKKVNIYGSENVFTAASKPLKNITYRSANAYSEALDKCSTNGATFTHLRFEPTQHKKGSNITNGASASFWYLSELHLYVFHDEAWKKEQLGIH